jgi:hypothetical protein
MAHAEKTGVTTVEHACQQHSSSHSATHLERFGECLAQHVAVKLIVNGNAHSTDLDARVGLESTIDQWSQAVCRS